MTMARLPALAGATLLLAACAATSPPPTPAAPAPAASANVDLDNAADGARVSVKRGAELNVILDGNASTGFQWQTPTRYAPVLSPIGERIFVPKGDPRAVGSGGMNIFRFRAEQAGQLTMQFDYKRSFETLPPARTVRYTVTVE